MYKILRITTGEVFTFNDIKNRSLAENETRLAILINNMKGQIQISEFEIIEIEDNKDV